MSKKEKSGKKEQSLKRHEVYHPLGLFDEFERAFLNREYPFVPVSRPWHWEWPWKGGLAPFNSRMPVIDIIDREHEVLVRAQIPGVDKDNLEVSMNENSVTIRGQSKHEEEEKDGEYFRRESSYGEFSRTVGLPAEVDADSAKAKFKDGVLEVMIQKLERAKRRSVEIE